MNLNFMQTISFVFCCFEMWFIWIYVSKKYQLNSIGLRTHLRSSRFQIPNKIKKTKLIRRQHLKRWTSAQVSESLVWWFASSYGNEVTTKISRRKTKLTFGWNNVQLCPQLQAICTSSTPLVKLSLHSNTSSPVYDLFSLRHILQLHMNMD